tara:strand:- start:365 stop:586 length:222 start_codon:yes stop_codon:yes gene_type:complete
MWGKKNFRASKRGHPDVFADIIVITDQDAQAMPIDRIKNGQLIPGLKVLADKAVNLPVTRMPSIWTRDNVTIV